MEREKKLNSAMDKPLINKSQIEEITENKTSLPDLAQRKGKKKIRLPRSGI